MKPGNAIMADYSHILLAVDFSRSAEAVVRKAVLMSQAFKARLSLIHVNEFIPMDLSNELLIPQDLEVDQELLDVSARQLKGLAEQLGVEDSGCHITQGSTRREILRVAREEQVDLIVIGSHGREGIQLLLGSTANAVLHGAPCDVLAVRVTENE